MASPRLKKDLQLAGTRVEHRPCAFLVIGTLAVTGTEAVVKFSDEELPERLVRFQRKTQKTYQNRTLEAGGGLSNPRSDGDELGHYNRVSQS